MSARGKKLSYDLRKLAVYHHTQGKSYTEISSILHVSRNTVAKIVQRFKREDRIHARSKNAGRPRILTQSEERLILRKIKLNPRSSAPKLTREVRKDFKKDVNPETIRRVLRRDGLHGRIARKKPFINERNRKRRLEYAREYYK